ncbi:hypothetical protein [Mucilaginibacter sp. L196]|uniref:hypothetical protein n=1 Tax=Mucilaginibacter sp. L196 TaxID=1641870 RepID=UPI00131E3AAC|nr:hypothetical protein [Mucilaginibacter sp. L196]
MRNKNKKSADIVLSVVELTHPATLRWSTSLSLRDKEVKDFFALFSPAEERAG